jgi:cytoskeletal protein RodZ
VGEFGEKLRKQREQRGITLESVAETTKIGTRMLKALEDERFDQLPGGVFNKGFVRAYARQIGLDAEEAVSEYLDALRESQAQAQDIMPEFRPQRPEPAEPFANATPPVREISAPPPRAFLRDIPKDPRPDLRPSLRVTGRTAVPESGPKPRPEPGPVIAGAPSPKPAPSAAAELPHKKLIERRQARPNLTPGVRIPWGIVAAALLFIALLLAFLSYHPRAASSASSQPKNPALLASAAPAPHPATSNTSPLTATSGNAPAASAASAAGPHQLQPMASPAHSAPATPASAPAPASAAAAGRGESSSPNFASGNTSAGNDSSPPAPPATPLRLLIRAEETSWVSIIADGKPVAHETLIAPAGTSVRANKEIEVRVGNAAGLQFVLNGKPLPRQGEPGEARTFLFDNTGVHVILPTTQALPQ